MEHCVRRVAHTNSLSRVVSGRRYCGDPALSGLIDRTHVELVRVRVDCVKPIGAVSRCSVDDRDHFRAARLIQLVRVVDGGQGGLPFMSAMEGRHDDSGRRRSFIGASIHQAVALEANLDSAYVLS